MVVSGRAAIGPADADCSEQGGRACTGLEAESSEKDDSMGVVGVGCHAGVRYAHNAFDAGGRRL